MVWLGAFSRRPRIVLAVLVVVVASLGACSEDGDPPPAVAPPVVASDEVGESWPTAGRDLSNSRAVPDAAITTATVDDLEVVWTAELEGAGALSTVPIVVDGIVYVAGGAGGVYAVDLASGELRWESEPTGFNIGPFGVAVDDERIYSLDGSEGVVALDRATGEELWSTDVTATPTTGIDIQPIVVDGLVLVSSVPISTSGIYAPGDRGVVSALDAETGEVRWTFDTVEGDLWGNPEVNSGGGAWYPPAVDEERGLVYVGVANPAPFPGTPEFPNGTSRPGPNLYTNSVVALDLQSGELVWYHQVIPHDLFDRDQVHTMLIGDTVVSAGKSGIVVGLDADDGTVLWERSVGMHLNDDLEALDGPTEVAPGTYGGVLTPPAFADGVVYVPTINAPTVLAPDEPAYFGAALGTADGEIVAIDATNGAVVWTTTVPGDPLGATTVVGDLVFTVLLDGTILALDTADGSVVWEHDLGGGTNGWLAALGDRLIVPVGMSQPPSLVALGLPGT